VGQASTLPLRTAELKAINKAAVLANVQVIDPAIRRDIMPAGFAQTAFSGFLIERVWG